MMCCQNDFKSFGKAGLFVLFCFSSSRALFEAPIRNDVVFPSLIPLLHLYSLSLSPLLFIVMKSLFVNDFTPWPRVFYFIII